MKKAIVAGLLVAIAAVTAVIAFRPSESESPEGPASSRRLKSGVSKLSGKSAKDAVRDAMDGAKRKDGVERKKRVISNPENLFAHLKGEDRRLAEAVQSAIDNDDFEATVRAAAKSMNSTNAEVRLNAVEALGWFGMDALPELTEAMADADEDVADAAENAWELALSEIDSADTRFKIAQAALATLNNADQLASISGQLSGAALEMIDGEDDEDKAFDKRVEVVQALVDIMDTERYANVEQAKEAYEDITGNEWRGLDEAEMYLRDPDNYELPEDREEEEEPEYADEEPEYTDEEPEYADEDGDSADDGYGSSGTTRSSRRRSGSSSGSSSADGFDDSGDDSYESQDFEGGAEGKVETEDAGESATEDEFVDDVDADGDGIDDSEQRDFDGEEPEEGGEGIPPPNV